MSEAQEQTERVEQLREEVTRRPERPGDAICEAISFAISEALAQGQFTEHLRGRGWALVYVGDGTAPEAPQEWLDDALDVADYGLIDPIGWLDGLWKRAWAEGYRVGRAVSSSPAAR